MWVSKQTTLVSHRTARVRTVIYVFLFGFSKAKLLGTMKPIEKNSRRKVQNASHTTLSMSNQQ